jgi:uncharacterized protein YidB (DUF937 family)
MALFDELASKAMGMLGGSEGANSGLLGGVVSALASQGSGGLGGLLQSFQEKGLGNEVASWIGTGENLPISAEQLQSVLGNETVQNLAANFGIPTEQLSSMIAQYLPTAVDALTPDGTMPEQS